MRSRAQNAELALLLEVAGTPKPGNVDRERDLDDLHFEHFLAGAVGSQDGLRAAEAGASVGEAFETAVSGMSEQEGGNTQFGCLLLLCPLVKAATGGDLSQEGVREIVEDTTVEDAAGFYRAFDHVSVFVGEPPGDADDLDVRRGSDAIPALRDRGLTLYEIMEISAPADGVASEWVSGFERSFRTASRIEADDGPITDRAARAFLRALAESPDTLVAKQQGDEVASEVTDRAAELVEADASREAIGDFGDELVERDINPGTTADITAAGLFIALERGVSP